MPLDSRGLTWSQLDNILLYYTATTCASWLNWLLQHLYKNYDYIIFITNFRDFLRLKVPCGVFLCKQTKVKFTFGVSKRGLECVECIPLLIKHSQSWFLLNIVNAASFYRHVFASSLISSSLLLLAHCCVSQCVTGVKAVCVASILKHFHDPVIKTLVHSATRGQMLHRVPLS